MSAALKRSWTRDEFLLWAEREEELYEFDGQQPVPMNGGTINHNSICWNIGAMLRDALRDGSETAQEPSWRVLGQGIGIATVGSVIRFPDVLVFPGTSAGTERLAPRPAAVFEVVSPSSGRMDHLVKVREYAAVPSILTYVIVESGADFLQVLTRQDGNASWTATPLTTGDVLDLGLPGHAPLPLSVAGFYAGVELPI